MTPARILIVEDDRVVARDIEQQLRRIGHTVVGMTATGEGGIALAHTCNPSLVLMDVRLEGSLDGIDAAHQIRTQCHVPVVFLTAYADDQTVRRASHAEPFGYLLKPFDDSQLRTTIEMALYKHAADEQLRASDRRYAEAEALHQANARLELALQGSEIGVWEFDMPDGNLEASSVYGLNFWGPRGPGSRDPATWADVVERWHPDDRERVVAAIRAYLAGATDRYEVECRYRNDRGMYRTRIARGVAVRDATGRAIRFVGSSVDISDRLLIAEALRESEERYRNTFENAAVGLVHTDFVNHVVLRVNQTYCNLTGWAREELIGRGGMVIIHPEDEAGTRERFRKLAHGELTSYTAQIRIYRKDGDLMWVRLSVSLGRDSPDRPPYAIGIIEDVSAQHRLERALQLAKEAAETSNRAKDEFLANVSHEIRTPMNAILGMTELVLDTDLSETQRQSLRTVKSAASGLLAIINDLLDFSKIEAGKLQLDPTELRLRALLGDTMRALAMRAHRKGLELICNVAPDAPDLLVGDAGRLRQLLINLVGNAIKFTNRGEVQVEVGVQGIAEREVVLRFAVRDTGIGIPLDKQETIFRAFEQEDMSTTRRYGGTGLGLTIASRLVAMMGGAIEVESAPDVGSTFSFAARFGWLEPTSDLEATRSHEVLRNLRVLVVDDNAANRDILVQWLRSWRMQPVAVDDGLAAMDALWHGVATRKPYALVLLDSRMPDTDGLALAAKIRDRAELSGTRIILLTSGDRPGDLERIRDLRIDAHVLKPVPQDELLETIHGVMTRGESPAGPVGATSVQTIAEASHDSVPPLRILVAEDNAFNAQLLRQLLSSRGQAVRIASDGREALRLAITGVFDLLLLDLHMPELDGFQVIAALREHEQGTGNHLPVIALTARSRAEDRQRCFAAGMDDFLAKPIHAAALWAAIEQRFDPAARDPEPATRLLSAGVLLAACGGDARILQEICDGLSATLPADLAAIRVALRARDLVALRERAHSTAGMLAAFSADAAALASELEDVAAAGQLAPAAVLVDRLGALAPRLLAAVAATSIEALIADRERR